MKASRTMIVAVFSGLLVTASPAMDAGLITLFEVALDPKAYEDKVVRVRCSVVSANLTRSSCPVWNRRGAQVGLTTLWHEDLDVTTRRRLAEDCSGGQPMKVCVVDFSSKVDARYGGVTFRPAAVEWVAVD